MWHHHGSDTPTSARASLHHTDQQGPNIMHPSVSQNLIPSSVTLGGDRNVPPALAGRPVVQLWQPQDEACFRRLCMVNRELQYDWLKVACSLYKFHWDEAGDFVMCNKHILKDLVERIIHATCMIYVHELRQGNGSFLHRN